MDHLRALIFAVAFFGLQSLVSEAHAGGWVEQTGSTAASPAVWVNGGLIGESACLAVKAAGHPASYWQFQGVPTQYSNETECRWYNPGGGNYYTGSLSQRWACGGSSTLLQAGNGDPYDKLPTTPCNVACPSGMIEQPQGSTTICTPQPSCPEGQKWDTTQNKCVNICPSSGTSKSSGYYDLGVNPEAQPSVSACDGGCTTTYSGSGVAFRGMVSGVYHYYSQGSYDYTGSTCTEGTPSPGSTTAIPETTCNPETQWSGEVNGVKTCLNKSNTSTTSTTVVDNPDGTKTKTEIKTDADGKQTTTTTTTDAQGNETGSTTVTGGGNDAWCAQHPEDQSCGNKTGESSGNCTEPPSCSGDPIACATLRQIWLTGCQRDEQTEGDYTQALSDKGKDIFSINQGLNGGTINLPQQLDQTPFLAGGSCPGDQTLNLGRMGTLTIPWSSLCPHINLAGNGIVLVSLLLGLRIMIGGKS